MRRGDPPRLGAGWLAGRSAPGPSPAAQPLAWPAGCGCGTHPSQRLPAAAAAASGIPGGDQSLDLLPSAGLVTSSEDYYPTVAINALMRVLREPAMASLHGKAVQALFEIIKAMGLGFVPYLPKARLGSLPSWPTLPCPPACLRSSCPQALTPPPPPALPATPCLPMQVVPVLLQLTRSADDLQRRIDMIRALTDLVVLMRQHIRKFLPDLLALVHEFWGQTIALLPHILNLLAELSRECRCRQAAACPPALPPAGWQAHAALLHPACRDSAGRLPPLHARPAAQVRGPLHGG